MNAELKALARAGGMELHKVEQLAALIGDDGVEELLSQAQATEKSADALRIAYKADATPADDGGDEYPQPLLDALEAAYEVVGDWQPLITALQQLATPVQPLAKLTDSGRQSVLPAASKAYNVARDLYAVAVGADQAQRGRAPVTTKSTPTTMKQLIETALSSMGDLH